MENRLTFLIFALTFAVLSKTANDKIIGIIWSVLALIFWFFYGYYLAKKGDKEANKKRLNEQLLKPTDYDVISAILDVFDKNDCTAKYVIMKYADAPAEAKSDNDNFSDDDIVIITKKDDKLVIELYT